MPFEQFDRSRLRMRPLAEREHDIDRSVMIYPDGPRQPFEHEALPLLAERIVAAARGGSAVISALRGARFAQGQRPAVDRPDASAGC